MAIPTQEMIQTNGHIKMGQVIVHPTGIEGTNQRRKDQTSSDQMAKGQTSRIPAQDLKITKKGVTRTLGANRTRVQDQIPRIKQQMVKYQIMASILDITLCFQTPAPIIINRKYR